MVDMKLKIRCIDAEENFDRKEKEKENGVAMVFDWEFIFMLRDIT